MGLRTLTGTGVSSTCRVIPITVTTLVATSHDPFSRVEGMGFWVEGMGFTVEAQGAKLRV